VSSSNDVEKVDSVIEDGFINHSASSFTSSHYPTPVP
jgi:hypothetical protein